ncbi:MAG: competence/damage-inducible protein A [Planctomycetes bacterium]|nr:competence/damage-inducible protein A [Planctomycetota bacterium]
MKAVIVAIGDELICGKVVDTNSAYLARQLILRGIETDAHWTIGDDEQAVASVLLAAAERADLVFVTGGLGPTQDDLTRQGLARAMGCELVLDEECLAELEEFFARRGRKMIGANRIQAMIPAGAEPLHNVVGTAAGIAATLAGARVFVMPGVPHEMREMFENVIAARLPSSSVAIDQRILHTFGAGESDVGAKIADMMTRRDGDVVIGTLVSAGIVSVRVTVRAQTPPAARKLADLTAAELRRRLGQLVFGEGDCTLASAASELLRAGGYKLATAESCTGGMISAMITDTPGSSDFYVGSIVAYANEVKCDELGVSAAVLDDRGAVSEEVARAMAVGCRKKFHSDWAISVTGIAGPGGGSEDKPVGLVYIAVAGPAGCDAHKHIFPPHRQHVRLRSALAALNHLRLQLIQASK